MAITLKNITPADTISSMVDKINFNFDQIILNGGGIEGPRGVEGYPGMQGVQGPIGNIGPTGEKGDDGSTFHILDKEGSTRSCVDYAKIWGLDDEDPYGVPYNENDIIIAVVYDNGRPYSDSIWKVVEDNGVYYPSDGATHGNVPSISFIDTKEFDELFINSTHGSNSLLRTDYNALDGKRGIVLNDYSHELDETNITSDQLDDIINNNVSLVYSSPNDSDSDNSPNNGIVFFKPGTNLHIGEYPRINYVNSVDNTINNLNIIAPDQTIKISAKNGISLNILSDSNDTAFVNIDDQHIQLYKNRKNKIELYKEEVAGVNTETVNVKSELFTISGPENTGKCISVQKNNNTSYIDLYDSLNNIRLNNTSVVNICVKNRESSILDEYYDQSRISIYNSDVERKIELSTDITTIGINPDNASTNTTSFGAIITKQNIKLQSVTNDRTPDINKISIISEKNLSKILLETSYPGVTQIANVSEEYADCILNYSPIEDGFPKIYTSPMGDTYTTVRFQKYANIDSYTNMYVRCINNAGAMHSGNIVFSNENGRKINYYFTRIGNIVQCSFNGIIDTGVCLYREENLIILDDITHRQYGEKSFKGYGTIKHEFPSTSSNAINPSFNPSLKPSGSNNNSLALNFVQFKLYPPVLYVAPVDGGKYSTGVRKLTGQLVCHTNTSTFTKSLTYVDSPRSVDSNNNVKIPSILISDIKTGEQNLTQVISNLSNISSRGASTTELNLAYGTRLCEIYGSFSYIIDLETDVQMHKQ